MLYRHIRSVQKHGVVGLLQRRELAVRIVVVALFDIGAHFVLRLRIALCGKFQPAASGALRCVCGQENLARRIGKNVSAYIPAVKHNVVFTREFALQFDEFQPHRGVSGNVGSRFGHMRFAKIGSHVLSANVDFLHSVAVNYAHIYVVEYTFDRVSVERVNSVSERIVCNSAVHCAGIQINYPEFCCDGFGRGALSGTRRSVYRDVDVLHLHPSFFSGQFYPSARDMSTHTLNARKRNPCPLF